MRHARELGGFDLRALAREPLDDLDGDRLGVVDVEIRGLEVEVLGPRPRQDGSPAWLLVGEPFGVHAGRWPRRRIGMLRAHGPERCSEREQLRALVALAPGA